MERAADFVIELDRELRVDAQEGEYDNLATVDTASARLHARVS